jgi:MFS family permease
VLVDTSLYAALTPLLPDYADRFGLSKTASGLLLGSYGIGVLAAAIPAGVLASRWGPKRSVVAGLALIAAASVVFAFAGDEWTLGAARVAQGIGSAATWAGALTWLVTAAPLEKRGQMIGTAMGAAVFGALVGPVLGAIADFAGAELTFTVFGGVVAVTALLALRETGVAAEPQSLRAAAPAFRDRRLLAGLWVTLLPALLFGAFAISVSFRLDDAGWRASAIAAVFLAAAGLETVMNPLLGRAVDRRGHLLPIRLALIGSIGFALALAWATTPAALVPLAIAGAIAFGAFYAPGMALVSESARRAGLAQAIAWGVMNAAWAAGNVIGPAAAGAISEAGSDAATWLAVAGICAATLIAVQARAARMAVSP